MPAGLIYSVEDIIIHNLYNGQAPDCRVTQVPVGESWQESISLSLADHGGGAWTGNGPQDPGMLDPRLSLGK